MEYNLGRFSDFIQYLDNNEQELFYPRQGCKCPVASYLSKLNGCQVSVGIYDVHFKPDTPHSKVYTLSELFCDFIYKFDSARIGGDSKFKNDKLTVMTGKQVAKFAVVNCLT